MYKILRTLILTLAASLPFVSHSQTISISSSSSDTICTGTSVTFTATASGGSHYQWLKNSVMLTGATNTTYTSATLVNGDVIMCELLTGAGGTILALSNPKVMTVETLPVVAAITGSDTVCRGATITLADATAAGSWNTSNAFVASVSSAGVVTGVNAGADTISYTVTNLCGSVSATVNIYVNTTPVVLPITGPNTICLGSTGTYVDTSAVGVWTLSSTGIGSITAAGVVTPTGLGVDTVLYTVTNACGVTVRRHPVAFATTPIAPPIAGANTVCQNDTIHLRDPLPGGNWHSQNNGIAVVMSAGGGGNTGIVHGNTGGTTTVVYVIANACGVDSATLDITVNPLPFVFPIVGRDSICPGASETLIEFATGGTWSSMNSTIATVDASGNVTAVGSGTDTVYYTLANSCGSVVQAIPITIHCPANVGVPSVKNNEEIRMFPNPAHDMLTIEGADAAAIEIINVYGQTVLTARNTNSVSVSSLANGLYFVTVTDSNGNVAAKQRLIKM